MKKLFALLAFVTTSFSAVNAAILTRLSDPGGDVGTSTVSVCNPSACSAIVTLPIGNTTSNSLARLTSINITFEYSASPGVVSSFNIDPVLVAETAVLFPGGFMIQDSVNDDRIYIRLTAPNTYEYYVKRL